MPLEFITGYVLGAYQAGQVDQSALPTFTPGPATNVYDLGDRLDRLTLVVEAMLSLMSESGISEDRLIERIVELDAAGGAAETRHVDHQDRCANCGAVIAAGLTACQFCGEEVLQANPFAEV